MRIIDIRTKDIPDDAHLAPNSGRFNLDVQRITNAQANTLPHYELEIGKVSKQKKKGWLRGWKQIGFSFTTHLGIRRYRIKTWFILHCFLLLLLIQSLSIASTSLNLLEKGKALLNEISPKNIFAAMVAVKETNKSLASLGEIPKNFSDKLASLDLGSAWAEFFLRVSGYYNPRVYLVMFQNNAEMRATGGFMGSYALIAMDEGNLEIKKLEGIYQASGQQRISVVPPLPIQKVSPTWMFHDANWFFDFPSSAKAISWFYEKTGGPTVDGVIVMTPELVSRLLALTGPIALPEFNTTLDAQNFITTIQYEVEIQYKERGLHDPKEILAHATPLLINRLALLDKQQLFATIFESLEHKEILFYFDRPEEEAFMNYLHWGGTVSQAPGDYIAVVNTNVNGFKTDRMINQSVRHHTRIQADGSMIDTVSITRNHNGGSEAYDWYNRVNGNFMRVYVPKGSVLLEARGHTKEQIPPNVPLTAFHYPALKKTMETASIDERTGTYVWEESGKTVFGNWVYVSPQESVTVTYTYRLPFRLTKEARTTNAPLTIQKQPGITYEFTHTWEADDTFELLWEHPTHSRRTITLDKDIMYEKVFSIK